MLPPCSVCLSLFLSSGCQVCGGEEEAAAGLPSHGDEQSDPDTAGVYSSPHQRDPAVSAAFLSVSGHMRACLIWHLSFFVCEWERFRETDASTHVEKMCRTICDRLMQNPNKNSRGMWCKRTNVLMEKEKFSLCNLWKCHGDFYHCTNPIVCSHTSVKEKEINFGHSFFMLYTNLIC